eukprot:2011645-Lingulodinium_polyedra.AAC.1
MPDAVEASEAGARCAVKGLDATKASNRVIRLSILSSKCLQASSAACLAVASIISRACNMTDSAAT